MGTSKKGPRALPPRRARAPSPRGTYGYLQNNRERFRAGRGVAVAAAWSWGEHASFKAGVSPCRLAALVNPEGDPLYGQGDAGLVWFRTISSDSPTPTPATSINGLARREPPLTHPYPLYVHFGIVSLSEGG